MPNVELKAYLDDPASAHESLTAMGLELQRDHIETDTYFDVNGSRLKYRESDSRTPRLIAYRRPDDPSPRSSDFQIADVTGSSTILLDTLATHLGVRAVVPKRRRTYQNADALVNLDRLHDAYDFIEIEVPYDTDTGLKNAQSVALRLMNDLNIQPRDILSRSYEELGTILSEALRWRQKLATGLERLVLIDGPSGAGKSTLVQHLTSRALETAYVRRTTSRLRREADSADEYEFISVEDFKVAELRGEFLEAREFLFDMRYGLRWSSVEHALARGRVALGVMNLGNIRHVRAVVPEVKTVLVTAPLDTLRRRICARGSHSPEAVEERLENAREVQSLTDLYDYVIQNDDGDLELSLDELEKISAQWQSD